MILVHWYPHGYFTSDGGWQGIRIVAGVDVVLGPLLTLVVFKQGKPGLKFDMSAIALFQTLALTAGTYFVYNERPVAVVFADESFHPISTSILTEAGLTTSELAAFDREQPALIYFEMPKDPVSEQALRVRALKNSQPVYLFSEHFRPINDSNIGKIIAAAIDMDSYLAQKPDDMRTYQEYLRGLEGDRDKLVYIPVRSRYHWFIGVFDKTRLRMIHVLDIQPPA